MIYRSCQKFTEVDAAISIQVSLFQNFYPLILVLYLFSDQCLLGVKNLVETNRTVIVCIYTLENTFQDLEVVFLSPDAHQKR